MRMFSIFPVYRTFLLVLMCMAILSLGITTSVKATQIPTHEATFSIMPTVWDPANPITGSYFVFHTQPGRHLRTSVLVTNTGTARGTVYLYPARAFSGSAGGAEFGARSAALTGAAAWIKLSSQKITLEPGKNQIVPFDVTIPANASSGEHIGGIVAENTVQKISQTKKFPLHILQRWAIAVLLILPGPIHEQLIATSVKPDGGAVYQQLKIGLSNTGNMRIKAHGLLQILDDSGHLIQKRALAYNTLLPQTDIINRFYIQHRTLGIGHYQAVIHLTYGHEHTLDYTTNFTIKAPKKNLTNAITTLVKLGDADDLWSLFAPWQIVCGAGISLILLGFLGYGLTKFCLKVKHQISQHKVD